MNFKARERGCADGVVRVEAVEDAVEQVRWEGGQEVRRRLAPPRVAAL